MLNPPEEQWELRADILVMLESYFERMGWDYMYDVVYGNPEFDDKGINKAIVEYSETMRKALKQLGRIATRLGYIQGE